MEEETSSPPRKKAKLQSPKKGATNEVLNKRRIYQDEKEELYYKTRRLLNKINPSTNQKYSRIGACKKTGFSISTFKRYEKKLKEHKPVTTGGKIFTTAEESK